jgi:hypothetical protein
MLEKVYPVAMNKNEENIPVIDDVEPFTNYNPCVRRKRFRRTVVVMNFINFIVKNVYQINDNDNDNYINKKIN